MTAQSKVTLKDYFNIGETITEQDMIDLIDSFALISDPPAAHGHGAADITSGVLAAARIPSITAAMVAADVATQSELDAVAALAVTLAGAQTITGAKTFTTLQSFNGGVSVQGGQKIKRRTVADAATTVTITDYLVAYTTLTAPRTVTLPPAASAQDQVFIIADETGNAGTHAITIDGDGAELINGAATYLLNVARGTVTLYSTGTSWMVPQ